MNCDAAQRRLLSADRPDRLTDDVRRHLEGCSVCRHLSRRLVQAERQIALLPVPPSSTKDAFVRRFRRSVAPIVLHGPIPWSTPPKERGLRKLSLAVAIAAVLAVFAIGLWSYQFTPPTQPAPAWVVRVHDQLDNARAQATPRQRVESLSALATDLQKQALFMARADRIEDLESLTTLYSDLVDDDLLTHARTLSLADRSFVLPEVADELGRAESQFSRLAAERANSAAAESLRRLALAAGDGGRHIRDLLKGAA